MTRSLEIMETIMAEKDRDIERHGQMDLDAEGRRLAEEKRFTFDIVTVPTDPLR